MAEAETGSEPQWADRVLVTIASGNLSQVNYWSREQIEDALALQVAFRPFFEAELQKAFGADRG